jgi:hypothetical protein
MTIDDLDRLFAYLYKQGTEYTMYKDIVSSHFKNDETTFDIQGMLIKLQNDGYVDTGEKIFHKAYAEERQTTYKLSLEGRFLYENSSHNRPYWGLKRRKRQRQIWDIAKTVITVLNSIAILYLMWRAIPAK